MIFLAVPLQSLINELLTIGIIFKPAFILPMISANTSTVPLRYRQFGGVDIISSLDLPANESLPVQVTPGFVASAHTYGVTHLTAVRSLRFQGVGRRAEPQTLILSLGL